MKHLSYQLAQITNPIVYPSQKPEEVAKAAASGSTFLSYVIYIWELMITVGGLAVLLYFLWGALDWVTSEGDSGKVKKARDKITGAIIGMVILSGSFIIIRFISETVFGSSEFNLLNLTIPTAPN